MNTNNTANTETFPNTEELEMAFYQCLEDHNIDEMMSIWQPEHNIVCILPHMPYSQGPDQVRELWEDFFSMGRITSTVLATHRFDNLLTAVHNQLVNLKFTLYNGTEEQVNLLSTQVYLKTATGWKMTVYHATIAGDINKLTNEMPNVLH